MTRQSHAESKFFEKAQSFFSQSQKAVKNYLISGKGLEDEAPMSSNSKSEKSSRVKKQSNKYNTPVQTLDPLIGSQVIEPYQNPNAGSVPYGQNSMGQPIKSGPINALYFSLITQSISDDNDSNPAYGLSLAVSIPVISSFGGLSSEFQISGDIQNAGDWGQVQFLQKESLHLLRIKDSKVDLFMGLGFGFGHGSLIASKDRYFAPWAVGLRWGKIYQKGKVFYRFEFGWGGDFYFTDAKYSQGLLANLSLGYKL